MQTLKSPLQIAKEFKDVIEVYVEQDYNFTTELILNEFEEVQFECDVTIDYATIQDGDGYNEPIYTDYEVRSISIDLNNVFDADGEEIKVSKIDKIEIEKHLEKGLKIELK